MQNPDIEIKSRNHGLYFIFNKEYSLFSAIQALDEKLSKKSGIFIGSDLSEIVGDFLSQNDKKIIAEFLKEHYKINIPLSFDVKFEINEIPTIIEEKSEPVIEIQNETEFIFETVRSGMNIDYEGNIIIIGDVNPGAVVAASGNIIVLGRLRGMAHAGSFGNTDAFVLAQKMAPIQLRIADRIAISPDEKKEEMNNFIARISGENIVMKCYMNSK